MTELDEGFGPPEELFGVYGPKRFRVWDYFGFLIVMVIVLAPAWIMAKLLLDLPFEIVGFLWAAPVTFAAPVLLGVFRGIQAKRLGPPLELNADGIVVVRQRGLLGAPRRESIPWDKVLSVEEVGRHAVKLIYEGYKPIWNERRMSRRGGFPEGLPILVGALGPKGKELGESLVEWSERRDLEAIRRGVDPLSVP